MDTEKAVKFMNDFRTIWLGLALVIAGAAWAGDTRWVQAADVEKAVVQIKMDQLEADIEELQLRKLYEKDADKIKMIDAMIKIKQMKIESTIKKYNLH